jgi:hypothetical protein
MGTIETRRVRPVDQSIHLDFALCAIMLHLTHLHPFVRVDCRDA